MPEFAFVLKSNWQQVTENVSVSLMFSTLGSGEVGPWGSQQPDCGCLLGEFSGASQVSGWGPTTLTRNQSPSLS